MGLEISQLLSTVGNAQSICLNFCLSLFILVSLALVTFVFLEECSLLKFLSQVPANAYILNETSLDTRSQRELQFIKTLRKF